MKKLMNKSLISLLVLVMFMFSFAFSGCGYFFNGCGNEADLRVFNCYEYIDETLLEEFEQEYGVTVEYSCFNTPEDCYKELKIAGGMYDLVCPSDYMIEKMAREDMLEEITLDPNGSYNTYASQFVKDKFDSISWKNENNETKCLADYAAGYMWGTLGLVYNTETVDGEDMTSWASLWDSKYNKRFSIKDSIRDIYFVGLAKKYQDELLEKKEEYKNGLLTQDAYQLALKGMFNDTEEDTVDAVKEELKALKKKAWGMEVDSGKDDIIKGNIDIYFAWSGDAVYAMDEAESEDLAESQRKTLNYTVPEEGSNIWFDGWCVPKGAKNKDLAMKFVDFLSRPENVIKNMEYIGYVSCVGGEEIFDWATETYGCDEGVAIDLSYFFGDNHAIVTDTLVRQFSAQYPSKDVIDRCVVMSYYPREANRLITNMWLSVIS